MLWRSQPNRLRLPLQLSRRNRAPPPPPPAGPKLGDKVGFIQLPQRPRRAHTGSWSGSRATTWWSAAAIQQGGRQDSGHRGDIRSVRPGSGSVVAVVSWSKASSGDPGPAPKAGPFCSGQCSAHYLQAADYRARPGGALKRKPFQIIADLMEAGIFANVNQSIDEDSRAESLRQVRFPFRS